MKKKLISLLLAALLLLSLAPTALATDGEQQYRELLATIEFIKEYGLSSSTEDDPLARALIDLFEKDPDAFGAIMDSMLSQYDQYTQYIPGGISSVFPKTDRYVGIGVSIVEHEGEVLIVSVNLSGSAFAAGVSPGDVITHVNGNPIAGLSLDEVSALLKGDDGTALELTVRRNGEAMHFTLLRTTIGEDRFSFSEMEEGVFYLKFGTFVVDENNFYLRFVAAWQQMKQAEADVLILDLRNNGGGDLNMALNLIDRLLPEKTDFVSFKYRIGDETITEAVQSDGLGLELDKIIILCNENTASASEIVMSSLAQLGYAVSVGETTYGKARGQQVLTYSDNSSAVITMLELVPPNGKDYQDVGLVPDYAVKNGYATRLSEWYDTLPETTLSPGDCSDGTEALNRALNLLGYLHKGEKLYQFGEDTSAALAAFCAAHGLVASKSLTPEIARAINAELEKSGAAMAERDDQLQKALELAREYVK